MKKKKKPIKIRNLSRAISRGAKMALALSKKIEEDYDNRWKDVIVPMKVPESHAESFRLYGQCRLPGCKCYSRPTFTRHRF